MPPLIQFMIRHFLIGVALGVTVVAGVVWYDLFSLGQLVENSANYGLLALFSAMMAITFGTVQMSVAVMKSADPGSPVNPGDAIGPQETERRASIAARHGDT